MTQMNIPLKGFRRELSRELFESLCALQCTAEEILGYIGTDRDRLEKWCRRVYRQPLDTIMQAVRQDGIIEIRKAAFELLKKSAPLLTQQQNRYIGLPGPTAEEKAREAAEAGAGAVRQLVEMLTPSEKDVQTLFAEEGDEEA